MKKKLTQCPFCNEYIPFDAEYCPKCFETIHLVKDRNEICKMWNGC